MATGNLTECEVRIKGLGLFERWEELHLDEFEETTGIPCNEIGQKSRPEDAYRRPPAAEWSPRQFGARFFPADDVDAGLK